MLPFNLSFGIKVALRKILINIECSCRAERSFPYEKIDDVERSQARIPTRKGEG